MPTQEERLIALEQAIQEFRGHIRETNENMTILLGTIGSQGQDIKRVLGILDGHTTTLDTHTTLLEGHTTTLDAHTTILEGHTTILNEHTALLNAILARLPAKEDI